VQLCGTPAYMAVEMVKRTGYNHAVDLWALGILIYEMMVGVAPFEGEDQMTTFRNIIKGVLSFPPDFSDRLARQIITSLLARDVVDRLGCRREGVKEIFKHAWFSPLDFDALVAKTLRAPWLPELEAEDDSRYFETYEDEEADEEEGDEEEGEEEGDVDADRVVTGSAEEGEDDDDDVGSEQGDNFEFSAAIPSHLVTPHDEAAGDADRPGGGGSGGLSTAKSASSLSSTGGSGSGGGGVARTSSKPSIATSEAASGQPWFEGF